MTNLFGFQVIKGELTEPMDGIDFITKKRSDEESEKLRQYQVSNYILRMKKELPIVLFLLKILCWFFWLVVFLIVLLGPMTQQDVGLVKSYHNAPFLYWGAVLCFVIWLVLVIYERVRMKHIVNVPKYRKLTKQMDQLAQEVMQILDIPEMAERIDVLSEHYIMKDGQPKHRDSNHGMTPYANYDMFVFVQNGNLCLADSRHVWEIPLSSLRTMTLEKKLYGYPDWHKSEPPNSSKYEPYRIIIKSGLHFSHCYRIEICDIRGEFYLLIPEYDGEAFTRATHLRPEEKQ